jgi:hypothetical protein
VELFGLGGDGMGFDLSMVNQTMLFGGQNASATVNKNKVDSDGDGRISKKEIDSAVERFKKDPGLAKKMGLEQKDINSLVTISNFWDKELKTKTADGFLDKKDLEPNPNRGSGYGPVSSEPGKTQLGPDGKPLQYGPVDSNKKDPSSIVGNSGRHME